MLKLIDSGSFRQCDGASRRTFLQVGGLAMGGLSLPQLLQAQQNSPDSSDGRHKAVIMIYLTGGPPHQDMVDLKPAAPADIRGEFQPIDTSLPGVQISELMPEIAKRMHQCATIRTVVGSDGRHSSFQCVTGRRFASQPQGGWPCFESIVSSLRGPVHRVVPAGINLFMDMAHKPYNHPGAGFLGATHEPFQPQGESAASMKLTEVTSDRLGNRRSLLTAFDDFRRRSENIRDQSSLDPFTEQALDVLTSSRLADALNLDLEDPAVRASYGKDDTKVLSYSSKGYQAIMSKFLLARRLVQAGVRCVSVTFADFDWHGGNFSNGRKVIPLLDQGLAALLDDLYRHQLQNDVTVVVWGEFGRTPRINKNAGRDHWTQNTFALLAGGGMPVGQVIGETNRFAEEPVDRPVHFQEIFGTLYRNLGIDTDHATISDLNGRPRYLLEPGYRALPELC
ncbi:MAG TPA: DUF1501 domain-containing protein [Planctomycetaceae bacterium]|nr:DUF1501 domain-containing protein [Planctomycetaceae bacterium]|tara:strand:+ start:118 stop:1470 length:1353 start_codon:yes stop_codon:yes gene_type:complete